MIITMVKKRLAGGEECRKCREATEFLAGRGLLEQIDRVVWFVEDDPASEGAVLAKEHGVEVAPFFIVESPGKPLRVIQSVMQAYRML